MLDSTLGVTIRWPFQNLLLNLAVAKSRMKKLHNTLIWLVITAAFIGPGTVTTALSAGARYDYALLWTLLLAVFTCFVLQEGAARIQIAGGHSLGSALRAYFHGKKNILPIALTAAILLGCAAYEAGNMLGAVAGLKLAFPVSGRQAITLLTLLAGGLLAANRFGFITNFLATLIGIMGLSLIVIAFTLDHPGGQLADGLFLPVVPTGAEILVLGLIGTTVVPYNLFLGSRLAFDQEIRNMRTGIAIATVTGGLITAGLILIGAQISAPFTFEKAVDALNIIVGSWGGAVFSFGLFAAGFTSAITAPWAAAITYKTTVAPQHEKRSYFMVWFGVLLTGFVFGVSGVQPVPMIILAQAANGMILPFLSFAILLLSNNKILMKNHANGLSANIAMLAVMWITTTLGLLSFVRAVYRISGSGAAISFALLTAIELTALVISVATGIYVHRYRFRNSKKN